jgi:hypothetical protein
VSETVYQRMRWIDRPIKIPVINPRFKNVTVTETSARNVMLDYALGNETRAYEMTGLTKTFICAMLDVLGVEPPADALVLTEVPVSEQPSSFS